MWWAGPERVTICLGTATAGKVVDGLVPNWQSVESAAAGFEQAISPLSESNAGRMSLDVLLSGALARPFIFEPVAGLRRWREAVEVASAMAPEATGLASPCTVWLDDWVPGERCVGVAMERALRDRIETLVEERRWTLSALRPAWSQAIDAARTKFGGPVRALAIDDWDSMTLLSYTEGVCTGAATYAPKPDASQARAILTRAAMASGWSPDDILFAALNGATSTESEVMGETRSRAGLTLSVERWA